MRSNCFYQLCCILYTLKSCILGLHRCQLISLFSTSDLAKSCSLGLSGQLISFPFSFFSSYSLLDWFHFFLSHFFCLPSRGRLLDECCFFSWLSHIFSTSHRRVGGTHKLSFVGTDIQRVQYSRFLSWFVSEACKKLALNIGNWGEVRWYCFTYDW